MDLLCQYYNTPLKNLLALAFMGDENVSPHFEMRFWRGNLDLFISTPIFLSTLTL